MRGPWPARASEVEYDPRGVNTQGLEEWTTGVPFLVYVMFCVCLNLYFFVFFV